VSMSFYLPPNTARMSGPTQTRTVPHREAISDAWAINLAEHVDTRLESPWRPLGLFAIGFLASLGAALAVLGAGGAF
jgi:hypothetical protein